MRCVCGHEPEQHRGRELWCEAEACGCDHFDADLHALNDPPLGIQVAGVEAKGVPIVGVDLANDYSVMRVNREGYVILAPELVALLQRLERALLTATLPKGTES